MGNQKHIEIDSIILRKVGIRNDNYNMFNCYLTPERNVVITSDAIAKAKNYQYLSDFWREREEEADFFSIWVYDDVWSALGIKITDDVFFTTSADEKEIYVYAKKVIEANTEDSEKCILGEYIKVGDYIRVIYPDGKNKGFCGKIENIDKENIYIGNLNDMEKEFVIISRNAGVIITTI